MDEDEVKGIQTAARLIGRGWPSALVKASHDSTGWSYAVGLRDGTVISFESARPCNLEGTWVHLDGIKTTTMTRSLGDFEMRRGVDVRVADITWASDEGH